MSQRNSRWTDVPRLDKAGKPVVVYPNASDLETLTLLNRYRYLPLDFIQAHKGASYRYLKGRIDLLARQPNKYLHRPEKQRSQPNANYRFMIYELSPKGETLLKDHNLYSDEPRFGDTVFFSHSLMITQTLVNLEMGCRSMIWFPEIAARLKEPHRYIPVKIEHLFPSGRKTAQFDYYNDSNGPFGVRYPDGSLRFLSLEAEHTNQVDCSNLSKTSFLKKFLAIRYIMDNRLYQTVWGLPNLVTLVVTSSQARINTMKELILRETDSKGVSYIAFAVVPVMEDPFQAAKPDPDLFRRPWQRAGHPDLLLHEPTAQKAAA